MSFLCPAFFPLNNSIVLILFISLLFIYLFIHSVFEHMPAMVPSVEIRRQFIRVSFLSYSVGPGDLTQMVRLGIFNH